MSKKVLFLAYILFSQLLALSGKAYAEDKLKLFSIQNKLNALELYGESEIENRESAFSPTSTRRSRLLLEENLETDFQGYIYHPNFVAFEIDLKNGLRQNKEKSPPNLSGTLKNSPLSYFHIVSSFLNKKPYAFSLSADKSREVKNREFFERQIISSNRYGGNFGFRNTFLPIGFSLSKSEKRIDRLSRPSQNFKDNEVGFDLSNESVLGQTVFEGNQNKFSRTESEISEQRGTSRNFNISNQKHLFGNEKKMLRSSLYFYDLTGVRKSQVVNLNENLNLKHTDSLETFYSYGFSDKSSAGIKTKSNQLSTSLRHKLYESLTSVLSPYYFKGEGTVFFQEKIGISLSENYTKRLGEGGRLYSAVSLNYSEDRRDAPDNVLAIIDETHTLTTGEITFLDKPGIDPVTIVVTDLAGTTTFILDVDYQLNTVGERTRIQRVPGGAIEDGQTVLIDYQARSNPSLKFNTWLKNYNFRVEFFDNRIGLFYNIEKETHPKIAREESIILQTLTAQSRGVDFNYRNLSLEFMREDFKSNLSPYTQWRLRESIFFHPYETSTITFQSAQNMVKLLSTQEKQKFFDFIVRYSAALNMFSRVYADAGYRQQRGTGVDLNDTSVGCGYELNYGKFLLTVKYDLKKQLFLRDKLLNHFFSLGIRRVF